MRRKFFINKLAQAFLLEIPSPEDQDRVMTRLETADIPPRELRPFLERCRELRERHGIAREVSLTVAKSMTEREKNALHTTLEKQWGIHVFLRDRVDPGLLAGFRLEGRDWRYDASLIGRVRRLEKNLTLASTV